MGVGGTVGNQTKQLTQSISLRVVLLSFVCHSDIAFISIMVLFFSSFFLLPRPLIVFKSIVLLSLLNEAPILWPPDAQSRLIRKDPYAGKD